MIAMMHPGPKWLMSAGNTFRSTSLTSVHPLHKHNTRTHSPMLSRMWSFRRVRGESSYLYLGVFCMRSPSLGLWLCPCLWINECVHVCVPYTLGVFTHTSVWCCLGQTSLIVFRYRKVYYEFSFAVIGPVERQDFLFNTYTWICPAI